MDGNEETPCKKCGSCERNKDGRCKACTRKTHNAWAALNSESHAKKKAEWRAANIDKTRGYTAKYYAANRDKAKVYVEAWQAKNKVARRLYAQNRRSREVEAGGKLSNDLTEKLFQLQKGKCPCCKQPLGDKYHLDHKMPLALGGSNTDDNMQLLRAKCNLQKNAKHPIDFMQSRGFLL